MIFIVCFVCVIVLIVIVLVVLIVWVQSGVEWDQVGFYISGSYGGYKVYGGEFEDENDMFGVVLGYQFNLFFVLEVEYIDFGNFGEDDVEGKFKGVGLSVIGCLFLIDSVGVYGKVGVFVLVFDVEVFDEDEIYDEVSLFVGVGVDFWVIQYLIVFVEYNWYNVDIDEDDFNGQVINDGFEFDIGWVGLKYQF